MIFENSNLYIETDFEIRVIRETEEDMDIIIPLEDRTLNVVMEDLPEYLVSRFQLPVVKNIIVRFCKTNENNICTIHLLRNIDLKSSIMNFEIDYSKVYLKIKNKDYFTQFNIMKKDN
ncbi:hypothetical protein [Caldisalinibacter kiritimatiensis]|uniref:Uncharacterized protein n=1 Tax=Caldisalinibacter kiritimatiensis TaxID=1304284 RepID=R1AR28_9FIRM|nr:hypothetical protein [Caldisalinibacter kiritimatiensis]EOC99597.1 hypothetical protein L21TH_2370 [Caldisalinibacter kiritimatiensis]